MVMDWVSATSLQLSIAESLAEMQRLFGEIIELDRGGRGYESSGVILGTGRVFWSYKHPEMGVHVSLSGSAIGLSRWSSQEIIEQLAMMGCKFTRVDFAFDDKSGMLSFDEIGGCLRSGDYVSRGKKWLHMEGSDGGQTWAVGSRASDTYLRIYDKAIEQGEGGHWVRVEMELKDDRAHNAVGELLASDDWSLTVAGWLYAYIDFKVAGGDSNKSRWDTVSWWAEFLGFVKKTSLITPQIVKTIEDVVEWVESQVTPSLYVIWQVLGMGRIHQLIDSAELRLSERHRILIKSAEVGYA